MIVNSRMNHEEPIGRRYVAAERYIIEDLKIYKWYKIEDLPPGISFEIIDLADRGFSENMKLIFNETFDSIMKIYKTDESNILQISRYIKGENDQDDQAIGA